MEPFIRWKRGQKVRPYTVYIGPYYDEAIVTERKLPGPNKAGSNRIMRLSKAMRLAGRRVLVVSPGVSMRIGWTGRLLHPHRIRRMGRVPILFCMAAGVPFIGFLLEPLFLLLMVISIGRRHGLEAVILYNVSPSQLLASIYARLVLRLAVLANIEDVTVPRFSDWSATNNERPVQQIIYALCQTGICRLAQGLIIPARRFIEELRIDKPTLVVTGCADSTCHAFLPQRMEYPVRVLFGGKIGQENGVGLFVEAMRLLSQDSARDRIRFDICGTGPLTDWLRRKISSLSSLDARFHGFVSDQAYLDLLRQAHVCLALQLPQGRHASYKTPSKAYECLSFGKAVIVTDVGDLGLLPPDVVLLCRPATGHTLFSLFKKLVSDPCHISTMANNAHEYARRNFAYDIVGKRIDAFISSF